MRRLFVYFISTLLFTLFLSSPAHGYDYGNLTSATLVSKAWGAFNRNDLEATLAYTKKCIQLYSDKAEEMQNALTDYAGGSREEVFSYWALNDIATAYFIQGEAYRKADMPEEALKAYNILIEKYTFGQCWDSGGWFWKPAEAAQQKIKLMEAGEKFDLSDVSPPSLTAKAWVALRNNDLEEVLAYANKCIELYGEKAAKLQKSLKMPPWESEEKIHSYGLLNDVGTCLFIKGEAYRNAEMIDEAKEVFKELIDKYAFSQCWDPQGWFWKPAEAAQQRLELFDEGSKKTAE